MSAQAKEKKARFYVNKLYASYKKASISIANFMLQKYW